MSEFLGLKGQPVELDVPEMSLLIAQREAAARASAGIKPDATSGFRASDAYRAMIDTFRSHGSKPVHRPPEPQLQGAEVIEEVVVDEPEPSDSHPRRRRPGPRRFQNPPVFEQDG